MVKVIRSYGLAGLVAAGLAAVALTGAADLDYTNLFTPIKDQVFTALPLAMVGVIAIFAAVFVIRLVFRLFKAAKSA